MRLYILVVLCLAARAAAHGLMNCPNQRGTLAGSKFVDTVIDPAAPRDFWAHFPAGDKTQKPGSGQRSQIEQAGPRGWTPFTPLNPGFRWRSGVCGDWKVPGKSREHLRGGRYYHNGKIVATYKQGGIIEIGLSVIAHHNGYMELHLCDVKQCDGEISEDCFKKGHCQPLERARNPKCDSGTNTKCAPIDRNYKGRWYFPCSSVGEDGWETYGKDGTILYRLPEKLTCEHCVLQWFWTSANSCNPPGVVEYFDGPDGPKNWPRCKGQGGAIGGVTRVQKPCAHDDFPEEYLQCADIRILPRGVHGSGGGDDDHDDDDGDDDDDDDDHDDDNSASPPGVAEERSSQRRSPKPSPSSTPSPSAKPSRSSKPSPSAKPSRSPKPSPSAKPSRSPRPSPSAKPSRSPKPSPSAKPSRSAKPSPSAKPSRTPKPSSSAEPSRSPKASRSAKPSRTPKPSKSSKPSRTPKPSRAPTPSRTPKPSRSAKPSRVPTPSPSPQPSRSPKPSRAAKQKRKSSQSDKSKESPDPSPSATMVPFVAPQASPVSVDDFLSESLEPDFSAEASMSPEPSMEYYELEDKSLEGLDNSASQNARTGVIKDIQLVGDGQLIQSIKDGQVISISDYKHVTFAAITARKVKRVEFFIDGERVWTEDHAPYYLFGNKGDKPFYWKEPIVNQWFELITVAEREHDIVNIKLIE